MVKLLGRDEAAENWPGRLAEALGPPIEHESRVFSPSTTMGVALGPYDAGQADELMRCAETAMQWVRTEGPGCVAFYASAMSDQFRRWMDIEADLQAALNQE